MVRALIYSILLCLLIRSAIEAKIPEPDTIFYGTVHHLIDKPLIPETVDQIQVQALVNGAVIATVGIPPGTNSYVLRIPMDDGIIPRIPLSAASGDTVHIQIKNISEHIEAEVNETRTAGVLIPAERGVVFARDLRVPGNLIFADSDMDSMPDSWEAQYTTPPGNGVNPLRLDANDAALDNDGDGHDNYSEYIAGTSPLDAESVFRIINMDYSTNEISIQFGPIQRDRNYALRTLPSLFETNWNTLRVEQIPTNGPSVLWKVPVGGGSNEFFTTTVELLP